MLQVIFFIFALSISGEILADPIAPSLELVPQSQTPSSVLPDLPYKVSSETYQVQIQEEVNQNPDTVKQTETKTQSPDFSKIPFIPSKGPEFEILADPKLPDLSAP